MLQERHLAAKVARGEERELGTLYTLLFGGLAGVAAETTVYPLQMMQRHLQLHSSAGMQFDLRRLYTLTGLCVLLLSILFC